MIVKKGRMVTFNWKLVVLGGKAFKLLMCKLLHFIMMRNFLEKVTSRKRMMFDRNRTERFVRDRITVTLACITLA